MTYIDYINQFWQIRRYKPMTAHEADFYFFLLKECNLRNWISPFDVPSRLIQGELGYSNKTIVDLRNRLKQKGLIDFIEGSRRERAASYILVTVGNQKGNQSSNQSSNQYGNQTSNQNGNPYIKTKNKTETIYNSNELFPEPKKKSTPKAQKEIIYPSLQEVKDYFEGKLENWEQEAETFFYHFDSLGWKNTNGARIERWDSRANLWIHEKRISHGNRTSENNVGNSVTVTATEQRNSQGQTDTITGDLEEFINSLKIG